jgi:hypothetical protein
MPNNGRKWVEIRIKTLPWGVWLKNLKRDFMQSMELMPNRFKVLCAVD